MIKKFIVSISMCIVAACSSKQGDDKRSGIADKSEDKGTAQDKPADDNLSVEVLVPMGLVDSSFLADIAKKIPKSLAANGSSSGLCNNLPTQIIPTDIPIGLDADSCDNPPFYFERFELEGPASRIVATRNGSCRRYLAIKDISKTRK